MNDIGYTIIGAAMLVISTFIMLLVACRCFNRLNKQAHYQRRKEYYRRQIQRERNRFIFSIRNDKTIRQNSKDNHQIFTLKGWYSRPLILQISFKDRPDVRLALSPPIEKINNKIRQYLKKPNVTRIVANFTIYSALSITGQENEQDNITKSKE